MKKLERKTVPMPRKPSVALCRRKNIDLSSQARLALSAELARVKSVASFSGDL
jgi:hypothetical protein